jgi:hypothetical protein
MYAEIEQKLGKDIFDIISTYNDLKTYGTPQEWKAYYRQNKRAIGKYYDIKDSWYTTIDQQVAQLAGKMPEGQGVQIRPDITGIGAQELQQNLQQDQPTFQDFQDMIPAHVLSLVEDYYTNGDPLPESATKQLDRLARDLGYGSAAELQQAIGISMYQTAP